MVDIKFTNAARLFSWAPEYILMCDNFAGFSLIFAEKKEKQAAKNVRQKKTP